MAKVSNEVKIGITVIVAIIVAFIGYRIMKDMPLFKTSKVIYTKFDQVYGLIPGNTVNVRGFKIGSVKGMQLMEDSDSTLVTLSIEEEYNIPRGSVAVLKSSGVLGGKYIEISKSDNTRMVNDGDTIMGLFEEGIMDTFAEEGSRLSGDISASIQGFEKLITNLNEILDKDNKQNISGVMSNLQNTTDEISALLNERRDDIDSMIVAARSTMSNLDDLSTDNKEKLGQLITNLEAASGRMDTLSVELNKTTLTLNDVLTKINDGEGSLGKLVNDTSLYNNLDSLTFNLNALIQNINDDPGKYLKHMRLIEVF
ncbi:MlaD family protein [Balneola sp. MJW-20]|uniref:MlaD family protein n=1 Tax=Gracilimonas aurantiaca TaxID=3234185 RepID=UPI003467902E